MPHTVPRKWNRESYPNPTRTANERGASEEEHSTSCSTVWSFSYSYFAYYLFALIALLLVPILLSFKQWKRVKSCTWVRWRSCGSDCCSRSPVARVRRATPLSATREEDRGRAKATPLRCTPLAFLTSHLPLGFQTASAILVFHLIGNHLLISQLLSSIQCDFKCFKPTFQSCEKGY